MEAFWGCGGAEGVKEQDAQLGGQHGAVFSEWANQGEMTEQSVVKNWQ